MEINFQGKRALVTGAAQGIGKGITIQLIKCGAKVLAVDISETHLKSLKAEYPEIEILTLDLTNWKETEKAFDNIGPIDHLVNCAGLAIIGPLPEVKEEDFDKSFNVNIKGLINITRLVIKNILSRKSSGSIVNISSQASKAALLNHTVYCATKGAVDAFTRAAALEFGPHNIRINAVNPTVIMTKLGKKVWADPKDSGPMLGKIPLGRFGEVQDVVDAVIFLLSDKASMITGTTMPIDGGFLAC